jgi:DNA-binding NtrC family response regulator
MKPRILLIDDEELILECLEEMLVPAMQVVKIRDGYEGLSRLLTETFHLVVTDSLLPGKSGIEILSGARQRGRDVPFIFLSGSCEPEEAELAKAMGAFAFIQKPFDRKFLKSTIDRALSATGVSLDMPQVSDN